MGNTIVQLRDPFSSGSMVAEENPIATMSAPNKLTQMNAPARLTRLPVASVALIRGRATGNSSEITLACDVSFASREKPIFSQWEVGVGMVAGGGPMVRLSRLIGRNRTLEVLLSSKDIKAETRPRPTATSIAPCPTPS